MGPGIVLVGARSTRQGTGPFLAAGLEAAGAKITGIVGTSEATIDEARETLLAEQGIDCRGYLDLEEAIAAEKPDAVALCSPWQFHARQLEIVTSAGCHCLVEKPLAWPASAESVDALVAAFERRKCLLQMVAQWPCTLPSFAELHGSVPTEIKEFSMRLSPISIGPSMITDSAPHFISMMQALAGPGEFAGVEIDHRGEQALSLLCEYHHGLGITTASLHLETSMERPRPAWYRINALRADREVELPEYRQFFVAGNSRVELPDPIHSVARSFLENLADGKETDGALLRRGHRNLQQLAAAWPDAARPDAARPDAARQE